MKREKIKILHKHGWKVGSTKSFLGLSNEEMQFIELKLSLAHLMHEKRTKNHLTQKQLAKKIKSSQSRVAKMENGDPSVSLDLIMKTLFALGISKKDIVRKIRF